MTGAAGLEFAGEGLAGGHVQHGGTADVLKLALCVEAPEEGRGRGGPDQHPSGGPPSFPGPDADARRRRQDRRRPAGHRRRRHQLPQRRPPGLLRRTYPDHEVVGDLDPRRTRPTRRQPPAQTRHVPLRLRLHERRLRLARQRISVLFAMLRDGTFYESRTPTDIEIAA
ncbi:mobile element protein [Streptomyces sp. NL15-2K]|nr:mobile element protein [Streptomyces sp. NL15-2K]